MTPDFVVDVNVLLPICCHIGSGMPYPLIFAEDIIALIGAMTDGRNKKINNDHVKFETKTIKTFFFACELSVMRVVTFGLALYRNQRPVFALCCIAYW